VFQKYVKNLLDKKGLSQAEMAKLFNCSAQYIGKVLKGTVPPFSYRRCQQLADALNLSPAEREEFFVAAFTERLNDDEKHFLSLILNSDAARKVTQTILAGALFLAAVAPAAWAQLSPALTNGLRDARYIIGSCKKRRKHTRNNKLKTIHNNKKRRVKIKALSAGLTTSN
jgi:transcriptional regulator with XRE-family HTH domain